MDICLEVIGCGGIGSYFAQHVSELISKKQLSVTICNVWDFDKVDNKTIYYQNFGIDELAYYKSDCIASRYGFHPIVKKAVFDSNFPLRVVSDKTYFALCVDNWKTRKDFFNFYYKVLSDEMRSKVEWIDMRSHGRQVSVYMSYPENTLEKMLTTLPTEEQAVNIAPGNNSCQNPYDVQMSKIQLGNRIVSILGSQFLLNSTRGEVMGKSFQYVI